MSMASPPFVDVADKGAGVTDGESDGDSLADDRDGSNGGAVGFKVLDFAIESLAASELALTVFVC